MALSIDAQTLCILQFYVLIIFCLFLQYNLSNKATLKKTKIGFQDQLSLNAGQTFCRMLQREHSAILSTIIKLPFVIKIFVLSIFEWPLKTGFTLFSFHLFSLKLFELVQNLPNLVVPNQRAHNPNLQPKRKTLKAKRYRCTLCLS